MTSCIGEETPSKTNPLLSVPMMRLPSKVPRMNPRPTEQAASAEDHGRDDVQFHALDDIGTRGVRAGGTR